MYIYYIDKIPTRKIQQNHMMYYVNLLDWQPTPKKKNIQRNHVMYFVNLLDWQPILQKVKSNKITWCNLYIYSIDKNPAHTFKSDSKSNTRKNKEEIEKKVPTK